VHAIKVYGWSGGLKPFIANLWIVWTQNIMQWLVGLRTCLDMKDDNFLLFLLTRQASNHVLFLWRSGITTHHDPRPFAWYFRDFSEADRKSEPRAVFIKYFLIETETLQEDKDIKLQLTALEKHFGDPERLATGRVSVQFLPKQLRTSAAWFSQSVTKNSYKILNYFSF